MKIMLSKGLVLAVIVLFVGAGVVPSMSSDIESTGFLGLGTLTFYPSDDTQINKYPGEDDDNYNSNPYIQVRNTYGAGGSDLYQTDCLIKFNISSIPIDTTVVSATLYLYYYHWSDNNPSGNDLNIYRITSDWAEEIVTWNTQPTYATIPTSYSTVPLSTGVWMNWDVTGDVQDFVDGITANYGWKITDENYWGMVNIPVSDFRPKEYGSFIPYLEIETIPTADVYVDGNADPGWYDATHVRTIQEGVDNATVGDTVFVYHGSYDYFEIDKVLYLIGEDKNTTFIDGGVKISADRVNISGFTIYNALKSGLYVASSNNSIFNNNIINNGYTGIDLRSNNDSIYENYIANNPTGISCAGSNHEIVGNTIKDSEYDGISLVPSNNNNISNNILINNGLSIWHPWFYSYYHNVVLNNTVNGKPLIYIERGIDTTLAMDAGQIILINCNNITILNQNISNSSVGIMFWNTSNCSISNSATYGQYYGIFTWNSTGNEILNNVVSNNTVGVFHISSLNSVIFSNTILNNFLGISIGNSLNNSVIKNKISHNNYGITLNNSCYNQVYHNIFIDNNQNAQDAGTNIWDNGYPSGGNYWDDYTGTDADGDGIGDTPYDIPGGNNQDRYPLGFFHPIADADGPYYGTICELIQFDGSGSYDPDVHGLVDPARGIVRYEWDFGDGHNGSGMKPTHEYSYPGEYQVNLTVWDDDGATDTNYTFSSIGLQIPPQADANGPYEGHVGESVQFHGSATGGKPPYTWNWDFGNGYSSSLQNPIYTYGETGVYTVVLTVTDDNDNSDDDTTTATIYPENVLLADAGGPYSGFVNESVQFYGNASGGEPPYSWYWEFGDGNTSALQNPTHIYDKVGEYDVILTVTDDFGQNDNDKAFVKILPQDDEPPLVSIQKPDKGKLYIRNRMIFPIFLTTVIIGDIVAEAYAIDEITGVSRVEFYLDDNFQFSISSEPYVWIWDERTFGKRTIRVTAYDKAGNSASDEIEVWKFF